MVSIILTAGIQSVLFYEPAGWQLDNHRIQANGSNSGDGMQTDCRWRTLITISNNQWWSIIKPCRNNYTQQRTHLLQQRKVSNSCESITWRGTMGISKDVVYNQNHVSQRSFRENIWRLSPSVEWIIIGRLISVFLWSFHHGDVWSNTGGLQSYRILKEDPTPIAQASTD